MNLNEYHKKVERVQKKIEKILTKENLSLVANYVKETNVVSLELIPVELLKDRNGIIDELMSQKGDEITPVETPSA